MTAYQAAMLIINSILRDERLNVLSHLVRELDGV
jgi:hypothetical protein